MPAYGVSRPLNGKAQPYRPDAGPHNSWAAEEAAQLAFGGHYGGHGYGAGGQPYGYYGAPPPPAYRSAAAAVQQQFMYPQGGGYDGQHGGGGGYEQQGGYGYPGGGHHFMHAGAAAAAAHVAPAYALPANFMGDFGDRDLDVGGASGNAAGDIAGSSSTARQEFNHIWNT